MDQEASPDGFNLARPAPHPGIPTRRITTQPEIALLSLGALQTRRSSAMPGSFQMRTGWAEYLDGFRLNQRKDPAPEPPPLGHTMARQIGLSSLEVQEAICWVRR